MYSNELYHHGVLGMKWGVRRYQNKDGTLTAEGRKRQIKQVGKSGKTTLSKGAQIMRVSTSNTSDAKSGTKLYVNPDETEHNTYRVMIGGSNIIKKGEAYIQKYKINTDIVMPSIKTQKKIERSLVNDKDIQKEMVESLMKKGMSREDAAKVVKPINMGKEYLKVSPWLLAAPINPALPILMATVPGQKKEQQIRLIENSIGDINNKKLNTAFETKLREQGYNAYRDTNDIHKGIAKKSVVIMDPDKNTRLVESRKMTKEDYGKAYANLKVSRNKKILNDVDYEDLQKDGEKQYEYLKKNHILTREKTAENEAILKKFEEEWKQ